MTLQKEEPGIWRAVCDGCGDDETLDGDLSRQQAEDELEERGWVARPPETIKFASDYSGDKKHKIVYEEHDCSDCAN